MATTSTVTIGSDTFTVYALTADPNADTDSFWNVRLGPERTAWEAASEDDQNRAMVMAADWMDRALLWTGEKTVSTQDRDWPRDSATCDGEAITDGTTPDNIFFAQAWLAGVVLVDNAAATSSGEGSNLKKVKAGSAEAVFFRPTDLATSSSNVRLPQVAHDFTVCYTEASATSAITPSITGTSATSSFCPEDFDFNEGLA